MSNEASGRLLSMLHIGANLAVLAGLVFVGVEVRSNRAAVESQMADGIAEGFIDHNLAAVSDPAIACIFPVGLEHPERLTDVEAARFAMYFRALFNQYIRIYALYDTSLLDEERWGITASQARWMMETPGGRLFFEGNPGVAEDFLSAVNAHPPIAPDQMLGREIPEQCSDL